MYNETLFEMINEIDSVRSECAMDTMVAMYDSYSKANVILENYEGDNIDAFSIFQEGEISDRMKESGKKYGTLMKILTFIPRLIGAIIDMFKNKISKKSKSSKVCKMKPAQRKTFLKAIDPRTNKAARVALVSTLLATAAAGTTAGVIHHKHKKDANEEADNLSTIERGLNLIEQGIDDSSIDDKRKKYISSDVKRMRSMIGIVRNKETKDEDRNIALNELNDAPDRIERYITELKDALPAGNNNPPKSDTEDVSVEKVEEKTEGAVEEKTEEKTEGAVEEKVKEQAEQVAEQISDQIDELNNKARKIYERLKTIGFSSNTRISEHGSYFTFIFDEKTNRIDVYVECIEQLPIRLSNEIQVVTEVVNALVNGRFKKLSDSDIDSFLKKQNDQIIITAGKTSNPGYGKTKNEMHSGSLDDEKNRDKFEIEQVGRMVSIQFEINNWNTIMEKYKKACDKLENTEEPIPVKIKAFIDERAKSIDKLRDCFISYARFFDDCTKAVDEIYAVLGYERKNRTNAIDTAQIA